MKISRDPQLGGVACRKYLQQTVSDASANPPEPDSPDWDRGMEFEWLALGGTKIYHVEESEDAGFGLTLFPLRPTSTFGGKRSSDRQNWDGHSCPTPLTLILILTLTLILTQTGRARLKEPALSEVEGCRKRPHPNHPGFSRRGTPPRYKDVKFPKSGGSPVGTCCSIADEPECPPTPLRPPDGKLRKMARPGHQSHKPTNVLWSPE